MIVPKEKTADRPLLLFKVGIPGSAPLGFCERLARDFETELITSEELRIKMKAIKAEIEAQQIPDSEQPKWANDKNELFRREVTPILVRGRDVVADLFFNSARKRQLHPIDLAKSTGALSVALSVSAPESIIRERLCEWKKPGSPGMPLGGWNMDPLVFLEETHRTVHPLTEDEGIDYIFELDGRLSPMRLAEQVGDYLEATRLVEPI